MAPSHHPSSIPDSEPKRCLRGVVVTCPRALLGLPRVTTTQGQGRGPGTCLWTNPWSARRPGTCSCTWMGAERGVGLQPRERQGHRCLCQKHLTRQIQGLLVTHGQATHPVSFAWPTGDAQSERPAFPSISELSPHVNTGSSWSVGRGCESPAMTMPWSLGVSLVLSLLRWMNSSMT